jgi:hypothetical protein
MDVMLSEAKHLNASQEGTVEILRFTSAPVAIATSTDLRHDDKMAAESVTHPRPGACPYLQACS